MRPVVIVVNGGSSSGTTSIVRRMQDLLAEPWLSAALRPDREPGMAARQADQVHRGVTYDVEVDTTRTDPDTCARTILTTLRLT